MYPKASMEHATLDEMMQDYADKAVELARDFHVQLDFTENSVQALEQILAQLHEEHRAFTAGRSSPEQAVEEQMVTMCKLWGGYLGEVVRRRWGGDWAMESYPGANFATLTLNVRGGKLFPSMKIYRRLTEGPADNVWSFYERVRSKLEASPQ